MKSTKNNFNIDSGVTLEFKLSVYKQKTQTVKQKNAKRIHKKL